jgi:asparagine synthase (glutamine-hydrolysing)
VFDETKILSIWNEHQSNTKDHGIVLWSMLMFEMWYEKYVSVLKT